MPDPTVIVAAVALVAIALLVVPLVAGQLAAAREQRVASAQAELAGERFAAIAAVAQHRLDLLEEARLYLVASRKLVEGAQERRAALDAALAGAPPGDELDAVDRLLRADADLRRRRAAAAAAPSPGAPAGDAGGALAVVPRGPDVAPRA